MSIEDHHQWRQQLAAQQVEPCSSVDQIDDALADPIHDHAPAYRSNKSTSRLLSILDEIERGDG
jgi:hypothetical protein